jgi:hypothetical protein
MFSNNHPQRFLNAALIALLTLMLAACGSQPPSCTSSDMGKTIKGILSNSTIQTVNSEEKLSEETRSLAKKYFEALKLVFGATVEQAHDTKTKLRSCKGDYAVSTPTGEEWKVTGTEWTAQITSDGKDFVVNLPRAIATGMEYRLLPDFGNYLVKEKKLSGNWDGKVICIKPASEDNATPPKQIESAFKLDVDGQKISGKGLTPRGDTSVFTGSINLLTDELTIDIAFVNPEGVQLSTSGPYRGKINAGKAQIKFGACAMDLKHS